MPRADAGPLAQVAPANDGGGGGGRSGSGGSSCGGGGGDGRACGSGGASGSSRGARGARGARGDRRGSGRRRRARWKSTRAAWTGRSGHQHKKKREYEQTAPTAGAEGEGTGGVRRVGLCNSPRAALLRDRRIQQVLSVLPYAGVDAANAAACPGTRDGHRMARPQAPRPPTRRS